MKKTHSPPASIYSFGDPKQAALSVASQRAAAYVRTGMATIYENDKATENEAAERSSSSQHQSSASDHPS